MSKLLNKAKELLKMAKKKPLIKKKPVETKKFNTYDFHNGSESPESGFDKFHKWNDVVGESSLTISRVVAAGFGIFAFGTLVYTGKLPNLNKFGKIKMTIGENDDSANKKMTNQFNIHVTINFGHCPLQTNDQANEEIVHGSMNSYKLAGSICSILDCMCSLQKNEQGNDRDEPPVTSYNFAKSIPDEFNINGNLITSRGLGTVHTCALGIAEKLLGKSPPIISNTFPDSIPNPGCDKDRDEPPVTSYKFAKSIINV